MMLIPKTKTAAWLTGLTVLAWILSLDELPIAAAFSLAPTGVSLHSSMNTVFSVESKLHQKSYRHGSTFRVPKDVHKLRKSETKMYRLGPLNAVDETTNKDDMTPSTLDSIKSISKTALSTLSFIAMELAFRRVLTVKNISFPPALAGCASLFTLMTTLYVIPFTRKLADGIYGLFEPGSTVLAKWLPVFFVPSLITLPLAPMPGSSTEILKVLGVIIGGFYFTLFSTAVTVLAVKKFKGNGAARTPEQDLELTRQVIMGHIASGASATTNSKPSAKPFSDGFFYSISTSAILGIVASIVASNKIQNTIMTTPLHAVAMLLTTLSSFVFGTRLPKSFTKFFHPLLTCTGITWSVMRVIGTFTNQSFTQLLQSYKVGTLCPVHLGAGDVLLFMLGPAVISLACQMYNRKKLMRDNILETMFGTIMSSAGGLFGTACFVKYLKLSSDIMRTSLMSRNITAAMALAIANILNASPSLAVSAVVITGLFGANFGAAILDAARIKDPVARGMGIGAAAHGLGTAAFTEEKDAFPFAAISMALTACASTVLVSIPYVKNALLKIALGS